MPAGTTRATRRQLAACTVSSAIFALALFASAIDAAAGGIEQRELTVTGAHALSGDTIAAIEGADANIEVRLSDIGAPQGSQPYASASRALLAAMVDGKTLRVVVTGEPFAGHVFGRVYAGELDVNRELVRHGAAWVCWEYAADTSLLPDETDAYRWRRGLWPSTWQIQVRVACRDRPPAERRVGAGRGALPADICPGCGGRQAGAG